MPTPPTTRWPKPKNEDEFEDIALDALKLRWADPNASRNGRRGQSQDGVDIVGRATNNNSILVGAQCKNTESPSLQHVIEEVAKAKGFQPQLGEFLFVTVADRDARLQEQVRVHFQAHPAPFRVEMVFWEDVVQEISAAPAVVTKHWPGWNVATGEIRLHVLTRSMQAPHYSPSRVTLRFSVTNLAIEAVKLTHLALGVERRIPYERVLLPHVGAPYEEFSLRADIRRDSNVDLLAETAVQFCLNPMETDAFRLECVGHGGVRYSCTLNVVALGLQSDYSYCSSVEGIDLSFPVHSVEDLIRRSRGDL